MRENLLRPCFTPALAVNLLIGRLPVFEAIAAAGFGKLAIDLAPIIQFVPSRLLITKSWERQPVKDRWREPIRAGLIPSMAVVGQLLQWLCVSVLCKMERCLTSYGSM